MSDFDTERKFSTPLKWRNSIDWVDAPDGSEGGYDKHGKFIIPEAMKELVILRARVEKLEKALSPFAKIGGFMTKIPATRDVRLGFLAVEGDGINYHGSATMLVADFLSARAALAADGEANDRY